MSRLVRCSLWTHHFTWILWTVVIANQIAEQQAKVCGEIDVRNNPSDFKQLEGCTVVAGSVSILLIEKHRNFNFTEKQFPELRLVYTNPRIL